MPDFDPTHIDPTHPPCELNPEHGPAYADALIPGAHDADGNPVPGRWLDVCRACFDKAGCELGPETGVRY